MDIIFMDQWKDKRVFISGGSGVIGTALVNLLLEAGAMLLVGDLKPKPENWTNLYKYREGDLITLSKEEIQEFSPECFFHLAATFERSIESSDFWHENFHHNILLSHHLLSLQKDLPSLKTIVFASSYLIYNHAEYLFSTPRKDPVSLKESGSIKPRNLCGMSKLFHEEELQFIKKFRSDLQIVNARIFRSYGKNSRDIISRWIQALLKGEPIKIYCQEGRFDFIYAEDVAKGLKALAESQFNGTINLGSGRSRSIEEVFKILEKHIDSFSFQVEETSIPYESSQADMTLFHQIVKDFTFRSLEETIPDIIKNIA